MKALDETGIISINDLAAHLGEEQQLYKTQSMIEMYMRLKVNLMKKIDSLLKKQTKIEETANEFIGGDVESEEVVSDDTDEISKEEKDLVYGYNIIESFRQYKQIEFEIAALKAQLALVKEALDEEKQKL